MIVCFKANKTRRNSTNTVEIKLTNSLQNKHDKKCLASYKFNTAAPRELDDIASLDCDKNEAPQEPKKAETRKTSSLRFNRGMSFRISSSKTNSVSRKITKMLIIVSTTFLILNLPVHSFNLYTYLVVRKRKNKSYNCVEDYLRIIFYEIFHTSFSCNFLLYSISGITFRNECKKLIHKVLRIK